jgi:hypothetical protein
MVPAIRRTIRRLAQPGLALALVIAQAMAAFGFPLIRPKSGDAGACGGGACGCDSVCGGVLDSCCCAPTQLTPPPPPAALASDCGKCGRAADACCCEEPVAEPEPAACPKCRDRDKTRLACTSCAEEIFWSCAASTVSPAPPAEVAEPALIVKWVAAWQASKCRGETPQVMAEIPAVPPVVAAQPIATLVPAGLVATSDSSFSSVVLTSLDPPPRCG